MAEVYTHDPRLMEKLELLAKKHPDQITRKDAHNSVSYTHLEKAAARADKAQANIPKKKVRQTVIDPDTGKKTSKLTFEDKKKPPSKVSQGVREAPVHLVAGKLHKEIRETEQDLSLIHI